MIPFLTPYIARIGVPQRLQRAAAWMVALIIAAAIAAYASGRSGAGSGIASNGPCKPIAWTSPCRRRVCSAGPWWNDTRTAG